MIISIWSSPYHHPWIMMTIITLGRTVWTSGTLRHSSSSSSLYPHIIIISESSSESPSSSSSFSVVLYGLLEHWDNEAAVHHVLPCVNVSHCDVVVVLMITMVILVMKTMVMIRMNIYCMSFWTSFGDSLAREIEHLAVTLLTNANVMQGAMQIWWSEDDKTWFRPEPGFWSYFS